MGDSLGLKASLLLRESSLLSLRVCYISSVRRLIRRLLLLRLTPILPLLLRLPLILYVSWVARRFRRRWRRLLLHLRLSIEPASRSLIISTSLLLGLLSPTRLLGRLVPLLSRECRSGALCWLRPLRIRRWRNRLVAAVRRLAAVLSQVRKHYTSRSLHSVPALSSVCQSLDPRISTRTSVASAFAE